MFQQILVAAFVKAIHSALCSLFGICMDHEECPDGVCDEALQELDALADSSADPVMEKGKVQAFNFNFQWDQLQPLVKDAAAFLRSLRVFLGLETPTGGQS